MGRYRRFRQEVLSYAAKLFTPTGPSAPRVRGRTIEEEHYPKEPLIGAAPNMGHDTDSYSSDWALFVDYWTRALYTSLSGRVLRDDVTITAGHEHDDYRTDIEWREFGRWRPLGDNQASGGPSESKGLLYVTTTSATEAMNLTCHIPEQFSSADLFVRVAQPAPGAPTPDGWLEVSGELRDLNTDVTATVQAISSMSVNSISGGVQFPDRWMGPVPVPLGGCAVVRGHYWVMLRLSARVRASGTIGGIYEVRLGKVRR